MIINDVFSDTHILSGTLYDRVSVLNEVKCHLTEERLIKFITIPVSNNVLLHHVCVLAG